MKTKQMWLTERSFLPSIQVLCYEVKPVWSWRQATNTVHYEYMLRLYNEVLNGCHKKSLALADKPFIVSEWPTTGHMCKNRSGKSVIWQASHLSFHIIHYCNMPILLCKYVEKHGNIYIYRYIKKCDKTLRRPWLQRPPPRLFHSPIIGLLPFEKLLKNFLSIFVLCRTSTKMDE